MASSWADHAIYCHTRSFAPLACGHASPELSNSCSDMACKLCTFTFNTSPQSQLTSRSAPSHAPQMPHADLAGLTVAIVLLQALQSSFLLGCGLGLLWEAPLSSPGWRTDPSRLLRLLRPQSAAFLAVWCCWDGLILLVRLAAPALLCHGIACAHCTDSCGMPHLFGLIPVACSQKSALVGFG